MRLGELQKTFYQSLESHYPKEETAAMFKRLVEAYLGLKPVDLSLQRGQELKPKEIDLFEMASNRLLQYEPLQYILKETEFYGLKFRLRPKVLIPRPETEELVAWILEDYKDNTGCAVLDIGTGSGCIAVSLAVNLPQAKIEALDVSTEALSCTSENAELHKINLKITAQDILKLKAFTQSYEVIVSNPPYVRRLEKTWIHPNVLNFEPHQALFVDDEDPLIFYRKIAKLAKKALKPGGSLYFEINEFLPDQMKHLLEDLGYQKVTLRKDFAGKPRMIKAALQ